MAIPFRQKGGTAIPFCPKGHHIPLARLQAQVGVTPDSAQTHPKRLFWEDERLNISSVRVLEMNKKSSRSKELRLFGVIQVGRNLKLISVTSVS